MRIGLITDTHIPWELSKLPAEVFTAFQGVDLILHAGDIYSHTVLDDLEKIAPVYAALGDDDYPADDKRVQERHILHLEGRTICLVHEGPPNFLTAAGLPLWWRNKISVDEHFNPDVIVAGHEHRAFVQSSNGILYVNSGSPTLLHYRRGLGTVGILELDSGEPHASIVHL
jgi:putative phosphoesterase